MATIPAKMKVRRGKSGEWTQSNPIIREGEIAFETDSGEWKVGDGIKAYSGVPGHVSLNKAEALADEIDAFTGSAGAKEIVAAADVVDIFIYDTRKDSDGGKWRNRCSNTSWYNETLNTATRGSRREFPQIALIVARAASVTIYDLDAPGCPMWMVFQGTNANMFLNVNPVTGVTALNSLITAGTTGSALRIFDFIRDAAVIISQSFRYDYVNKLVDRNATTNPAITSSISPSLPSNFVNDVAATILPGTPIDSARGLPNPTIAVATAGGVSVIHWDGRVCNSTTTYSATSVAFDGENLYVGRSGGGAVHSAGFGAIALTGFSWGMTLNSVTGVPTLRNNSVSSIAPRRGELSIGTTGELNTFLAAPFQARCGVAYINNAFNTGHMVGDIKMALAESTADVTSLVQGGTDFPIGGTEKAPNGGAFDTVDWSAPTSGSIVGQTWSDMAQFTVIPFATALVTGRRYIATIACSTSGGSSSFNFVSGGGSIYASVNTSKTFAFTAVDTNPRIIASAVGSLTVTSFSIKEAATAALYDDFSSYADTAAMLAAGWTAQGNALVTLSSDKIRVEVASSSSHAGYRIVTGLTAGVRYLLRSTISAKGGESYNPRIYIGSNTSVPNHNNLVSYQAPSSAAPHAVVQSFVATTTSVIISMNPNTLTDGAYFEVDDIRIDRVAEDRSVSGNHPIVKGTVTRAAVASGAELAAYGGFSTSNYLEVPSSPSIEFGAGDMCIVGWVNPPVTDAQAIMSYENASAGNGWVLDRYGGLRLYTGRGGINKSYLFGDLVAASWQFFSVYRKSGYWYGGVNGAVSSTGIIGASDTFATGGVVRIGVQSTIFGNAWGGTIALPRISATVPTPAQIRAMYEAERHLFLANAKCLLPGANVSALAYDASTDLLHVATTAGSASMRGLVVVDKDANVYTGLDARSGIVATRDSGSADAVLPDVILRESALIGHNGGPSLYDEDVAEIVSVTANATPTVTARFPIAPDGGGTFQIFSVAREYGDGPEKATYVDTARVDRPGNGNIIMYGSSTQTVVQEVTNTMAVTISVNTTTQTIDVTSTGIASKNIEWRHTIERIA